MIILLSVILLNIKVTPLVETRTPALGEIYIAT